MTKFNLNNFVDNLDALRNQYQKCADNFTSNPHKFIDEMALCLNNKETIKDLAKKLNYPQDLVKHIIYSLQNDFDDDHWKLKEYITKKTNGKFLKLPPNLIEILSRDWTRPHLTPEKTLNIYLNDNQNWLWGDYSLVQTLSPFPLPEEYTTIYNDRDTLKTFDLSSQGWYFSLRLENYGNKHYFEAKSKEEKKEILEMYRLMNKYLGH